MPLCFECFAPIPEPRKQGYPGSLVVDWHYDPRNLKLPCPASQTPYREADLSRMPPAPDELV